MESLRIESGSLAGDFPGHGARNCGVIYERELVTLHGTVPGRRMAMVKRIETDRVMKS